MIVQGISFLRACGLALCVFAGPCFGIPLTHELEDGFVERAVQTIIRDDELTVTYSFGLTLSTMQKLLDIVKNQG